MVAAIRGELANWAYASQTIKLSTLLPVGETPVGEPEDERVERLINAGNRFCREHVSPDRPHGDPAAVARLAVKRIRELRRAYQRSSESRAASRRFAYVIHSLKRPAEVNLLREIYGPQFVLLASQGTSDERLQNLMTRPLSAASDEAKRDIARRPPKSDDTGRFVAIDRATAQPRLGDPKQPEQIDTEERVALNALKEEYR